MPTALSRVVGRRGRPQGRLRLAGERIAAEIFRTRRTRAREDGVAVKRGITLLTRPRGPTRKGEGRGGCAEPIRRAVGGIETLELIRARWERPMRTEKPRGSRSDRDLFMLGRGAGREDRPFARRGSNTLRGGTSKAGRGSDHPKKGRGTSELFRLRARHERTQAEFPSGREA
jgi:hypothetical protein